MSDQATKRALLAERIGYSPAIVTAILTHKGKPNPIIMAIDQHIRAEEALDVKPLDGSVRGV